MAGDLRGGDTAAGDLSKVHAALKRECLEQAGNTVYTFTTFYTWLRTLKWIRAALWLAGAASSVAAASTVLSGRPELDLVVAGLALLGAVLPAVIKAVKLDETIGAYERAAARFRSAEAHLRRAGNVWSLKPLADFEKEARAALVELDEARQLSLTPPEWCFNRAKKKVQAGDYDPDPIRSDGSTL